MLALQVKILSFLVPKIIRYQGCILARNSPRRQSNRSRSRSWTQKGIVFETPRNMPSQKECLWINRCPLLMVLCSCIRTGPAGIRSVSLRSLLLCAAVQVTGWTIQPVRRYYWYPCRWWNWWRERSVLKTKIRELEKTFPFGSHKVSAFTFAGIEINQHHDHSITLNQSAHVRKINPIAIESNRKNTTRTSSDRIRNDLPYEAS